MTAVSSVYAQRFILTIFLISFGIYLFVATVTYTPFDPGWMHVSSDTQQVSNASGIAGAWIADLLFGFLGWASVLIPIFLFAEAIQVWWPRSFLSRPFRYAAKFFTILCTSSLLYLLWDIPADTLSNASGGIIGFEVGQSLKQLLSIYGAVFFLLILWLALFTLAFGIQWNKTWATLQATPAYLQELFYRNVPESESAFDRTQATKNAKVATASDVKSQSMDQERHEGAVFQKQEPKMSALVDLDESSLHQQVNANSTHDHADQNSQTAAATQVSDAVQNGHITSAGLSRAQHADQMAQRLFNDMVNQQHSEVAKQAQAVVEPMDDQVLEQTIAKAHQLQQDTQQHVPTGEVWKALNQQQDHKQDIDNLLRAAEEGSSDPSDPIAQVQQHAQANAMMPKDSNLSTHPSVNIDWDDDQVFDSLLERMPSADQHSQTNAANTAQQVVPQNNHIQSSSNQNKPNPTSESDAVHVQVGMDSSINARSNDSAGQSLASELDALANLSAEAQSESPTTSTLSEHKQSLISQDEKLRVSIDKDAFRHAWLETTGVVETEQHSTALDEEDYDFDAPLTDSSGRPMSRAMQVANKRLDLPTLPGFDLLDEVDPNKKVNFSEEQLARLSELLEIKLQEFNVKAKVVEAQPGPVVTRFQLDLAPGIKASKVTNISRDLARSMSMASVRVVEVIPGKPYIGVEVPNSAREMVRLIELLKTPSYRDPDALISMAMGKDISGNPVLTDLSKAPHMLVAGTTGSGKSVAVNAMILSMLLKYTPDQLRLILIDPKQLELANYNDIPHLLTPVVTDMKDAVSALNWCVNEMERRYKLMSFLKIRKISDYNRKVEEALANGEDLIDPTWKPSDSATQQRAPRLTPLPMIVIVADEFADMIMQVGKKAEEMITRLAQKSRAAGIHLLLATQRPSVDVITGLIKANIPTRVALRVNSKIDSRTILDAGGAEDLLGHGDMLFLGPGKIEPERVHGAFISDDEVNRICDAWRERGEPDYVDEILTPFDEEPSARGFEDGDASSDRDALYDQCVAFVLETRRASTSSLQRKFSLGYNRAARIIDQMEENGIVSAMGTNGKRDILV